MKRLIMVSLGALLFSPMPGRVQAADTPPAAMSDTKKPDAGQWASTGRNIGSSI